MKKYDVRKTFTYEDKRYVVRADTEKEAIIKMANKIRDLEEGKVIITKHMTVREWCNECVDKYKTNLAETTMTAYKNRMRRCIIDKIGNRKLCDVKPLHCQAIMNDLSGCSKAHINAVYQMLQFVFDRAVDNGLLISNPATHITKPKGYSGTRRSITQTEREHILSVADTNPRFLYFLFMLYCGCRPSEAAEIKGMDVQVLEGHNVLHIRGTKTDRSDRLVPIPDKLYDQLPKVSPFDYFVPNTKGQKMSIGNRNDLWRAFRRALNIDMGGQVYRNQLVAPYPLAEDLTPYCLRHTFCTDLQKAGVDIRTAQYLMGHATIDMTANVYTHADNETIVQAAEILKGVTPGVTLKRSK